jgi:hypothetical protein
MDIVTVGHTAPADERGRMPDNRAISALLTRPVVIVIVRGGVGNMSARAAAKGRAGRTIAAVWGRRND